MKVNKTQLQDEQESRLLTPNTDYSFEVIGATEKPNAKSSDGVMTALVLAVYDEAGKKHKVKDNLGQWNFGATKIKSFLESIGENEDADIETDDLIGRRGIVHTKHGEFNGQKKDEIAWYVPALPGQKVSIPAEAPEIAFDEDSLPF
jgi:hypothetical protein